MWWEMVVRIHRRALVNFRSKVKTMGKIRTKAWCNHYSGMHLKTACDAGVQFDSLPHYGTKEFMDACPCFSSCGGCDKAEYPTPEQLAAAKIEMDKRFENTIKARMAIVEHCGGPWKRGMPAKDGRIDCPVCGKEAGLGFSRSGYNGHIHASCVTEDCVRWME